MILNKKNREQVYNEIVEQVRDGIVVKEREQVIFSSNQNAYLLEGAGLGTISIVSVTSIEGIRNDGFYAHPTETFNGIAPWSEDTDFVVSGSVSTVAPSTAGVIAGNTLYDYIVWQGSDKPEDGSSFLVTYKYYDANKTINPNRPISFSPGSIGNAFASAFSNIVGNMYNELDNTHQQGKIQTSTGEDLELHGENYGLKKRKSTSSTGYVEVTNNSGEDIDITISNRFTTSGFNSIVFIPQESKTIGNGTSDVILVQSSLTGFTQNVGINVINQLFEGSDLSVLISGVVIANPGTVAGSTNLFNDGANVESDNSFRNRILSAINKRGTATKSAIAGAVQNLASVRQAKVYDFEDKKSIPKPNIHIFVVGETDKIIQDPVILSNIGIEIQEVKSAGIQFVTTVPMGVYVDISGSVFVDRAFATQKSAIISDVSTAISNYINDLNVGEDVVYSRIVEEAMKISNVKKVTFDEFKFSEYSFHPYDKSTTWQFYASGSDADGTFDRPYGQQFTKLAKGYQDVFTYDGTSVYTTSGSQISSSITPSVYIGIQDQAGSWVRDPQYLIDWYSSFGANTITIDTTAGDAAGVSLLSGTTKLIFNYESYENHDFDGVRVLMSGSQTGSSTFEVEVSMWSGTTEPTTKHLSGTILVTAGSNEYDIIFDYGDDYMFDPATQVHWIVISGVALTGSLSGVSLHIPLETSSRGAFGSPLTKWYSGSSTWEANTSSERYMELVSLLLSSSKDDVDISNLANKSEIAVLNNTTLNGFVWEGDEF